VKAAKSFFSEVSAPAGLEVLGLTFTNFLTVFVPQGFGMEKSAPTIDVAPRDYNPLKSGVISGFSQGYPNFHN
jgi:hypothetical protein